MPELPLTLHRFARFYAPLAATSLLLTLTNPLLISAMSRGVNPTIALAGFGVAFSLCGVLYSPVLVSQQVAAAKLLNGRRFRPIQSFWLRIGALSSLVAVAVAFTPLGDWVFGRVMGVSGDIFDEARTALAVLAPIPLLTSVRAVHQGRLVAGHRTNPIAVDGGRVRLSCNGELVAEMPIGGLSAQGVAGVRVNHNLRVRIQDFCVEAG